MNCPESVEDTSERAEKSLCRYCSTPVVPGGEDRGAADVLVEMSDQPGRLFWVTQAGGQDRRDAAVTVTDELAPEKHADNKAIGAATVLTAAALWGTVGPAQVLAASAADPGALGVERMLLGGLGLALFCRRPAAWRAVTRRDVIGWVLLAALATGVYQVTFMHAVEQLGAALGITIALGVAPITTGLCAHWWTGERLILGWPLGIVAAVSGRALRWCNHAWSNSAASSSGSWAMVLSNSSVGA